MASCCYHPLFAALAILSLLPAACSDEDNFNNSRKLKPRIAVVSDLHFGQTNVDSGQDLTNTIAALQREKTAPGGLDHVVIVGDLVMEKPEKLSSVRDAFASLGVPFHATPGNHDCATEQLWRKTFGHGMNSEFTLGNGAVCILANSGKEGAPGYRLINADWLQARLAANTAAPGIILFTHAIPKKMFSWLPFDDTPAMTMLSHTTNLQITIVGDAHGNDNGQLINGKNFFWTGRAGGDWGVRHCYRIIELNSSGAFYTYIYGIRDGEIRNPTNYTPGHILQPSFLHVAETASQSQPAD